jgi:hypothetical protein
MARESVLGGTGAVVPGRDDRFYQKIGKQPHAQDASGSTRDANGLAVLVCMTYN